MNRHLQRGVALVEFALVLPVLILLGMITAEFGRALYQYDIVVKSVRNAARWASTQTPSMQATIDDARRLAVYGRKDGSGSTVVPGLSTNQVTVTWQLTGSDPVIRVVTVQVNNYVFDSMVTGVFGTTFPALTIPSIRASMRSPL